MYQSLTIPQHRDPVARAVLVACALALVWLAIAGIMPPAQAQEQPTPQTIILIATPTLPAPAPEMVPALSAATAAPAPPVAAAPVAEAPAAQQLAPALHPHERVSDKAGPGQPDPELEIQRAAAEAYQTLPAAAAPSAENQQPNYSKRPHTGR